jgi:hypothetical protein
MKEIVRRFDETICEKISKTHLMVFRSQLTDEYQSKEASAKIET